MRLTPLFLSLLLLGSGLTSLHTRESRAEEASVVPGAPRLLPERTLAYFRIENADEFRQEIASSATGRMLADPKLRPIASEFYLTAAEIFAEVGKQLGISLDELLAIPKGQFAFAIYLADPESAGPAKVEGESTDSASKEPVDESPDAIRKRIEARRATNLAVRALVVIETGKDDASLQKLLKVAEEKSTESGSVVRRDKIEGTTLVRLIPTDSPENGIEYFSRDGATVIGIGSGSAESALLRWNGQASGPTLAESTEFAAVMGHCIGAEETRPQITFYFDPYRAVERIIKGSGGAAMIWPIVEDLGFNKIRGVGGSVFQGGEMFDDISHMHILLDPPRDGVFSVIRPTESDTNPPSWVPDDVASYMSVGWRVDAAFNGFEKIFDRFAGENGFATRVTERFQKDTGMDLRESLVNTTKDRGVIITWLQQPVTLNSNTRLMAIELKDPAQTTQTIEKLRETVWKRLETDNIGATKIYRGRRRDREVPAGLRQPEPCGAIVGDWLMVSDSRQLLEHVIRTHSGAVPRLSSQPEYDLVASEMGAQLKGEKPFLFSFSRDSEALRQVYEIAKSPQVKEFVRSRGEENPVVKRIAELIEKNELPPFDEFKKYFAPSGGFAYDEPTGMHFGRYTLKAE
jgi:hypothetical protein